MELEVVSHFILQRVSLADIQRLKFDPELLAASPEAVMIFNYCMNYARKHDGFFPSASHIKRRFPDIEIQCHEAFEDALATLKRRYLLREVSQLSKSLESELDLQKIEKIMLDTYHKLLTKSVQPVVTAFESTAFSEVVSDYLKRKAQQGLIGYEWPWDIMNQYTPGVIPGYYVFYGFTKTMKTWIVLYILASIYAKVKPRIGIYSKEMQELDVKKRFAAILAKVDYKKMTKGQLLADEEQRLQNTLLDLSRDENRIFIFNSSAHIGPKELYLHAKNLELDILFVDSAYLLSNEVGWQQVAKISSQLLELSRNLKIPIFVTTQEHERTAKILGRSGTASIAYSSKFAQDADMAIHLYRFPSGEGEFEIGLEFPATRDAGDIPSFTIRAHPAYDFSFKHRGIKSQTKNFEAELMQQLQKHVKVITENSVNLDNLFATGKTWSA